MAGVLGHYDEVFGNHSEAVEDISKIVGDDDEISTYCLSDFQQLKRGI